MIAPIDIDSRLEEYSQAFDFYIENGKMPPNISTDDSLIEYMKDVIDSYPHIENNDPVWIEVLKDELIHYLTLLLEHFKALQTKTMQELALIERFKQADIDLKMKMLNTIINVINAGYSKYDVNLQGYIDMLNTDDKDTVLSALASDWENACKAKHSQKEKQLVKQAKNQHKTESHKAGIDDYNDKKQIEDFVYSYPQLKEIIDLIGRDNSPAKDENDTIIYKFLPVTVSKNNSVEEIDRVESGDNLERVIPAELSMPEDLFFKRYATKELQQFSSPGKGKPKKIEEHRKDPRLTKGPIIVSIDTSGSMDGYPLKIAFSLLKQLLSMAKKQKRSCYLISFSVRSKSIDLAKPQNWSRVNSFLENSFSGGTDGEQMLAEALSVLQKGTYEMADILIISDFEFNKPQTTTMAKIDKEKTLGTRFYGLRIGNYGTKEYETKVLDKMWTIN